MDVNTQLDGFIVHPLDAFNDKHHEDNIPKFSSTAPHLDGFIVHPIDSFISHERNGGGDYSGLSQINNNFNNNNYETENIFNQNNDLTNYELNQASQIQDLFNTTPINNNEFDFNQYETSNLTTSEYPITHTEPTPTNYNYDYNYVNSTTSDISPSIPETNYINTTSSYTNYNNFSNYTNYSSPTTDFQYSQILPTKYLPTMVKNNNINSTPISQVSEIPITSYTSSLTTSYNNSYSVPSQPNYSMRTYKPVIKMKAFTSQVKPKKTIKNNNKTKYIYNTYSVSAPKKYRITTFNPQIKWKKIIPIKKKIIIPKVKKYLIPRKTTYFVPKKKTIIIPKPVLAPIPTIQSNIIVPTISIVTTGMEKYPLDNFAGRNRMVSDLIAKPKIYLPRDVEMKRKNKF